MSWKTEFGRGYDVPDFIEFLMKEGVVEDSSWHNDVAPSFSHVDDAFTGVRLWVEHPLFSERESGGTRFCVSTQVEGSQDGEDLQTDDLEEAVEELLQRIEQHERPGDPRSGAPYRDSLEQLIAKYLKRLERQAR